MTSAPTQHEPPTPCPKCGQPASGKFCSHCGSTLAQASCAACGAGLTAAATFCHKCGAPRAAAATTAVGAPQTKLIWFAAPMILAIAFVLGWFASRTQTPPPAPGELVAQTAQPGPVRDFSTLPPLEQAHEMWNVVMTAYEAGDQEAVTFHGPIALTAYANTGAPTLDTRYHIGMVHVAMGDAAGATAQADTVADSVPNHLFATILRSHVAEINDDQAALAAAFDRFLADYESELAAGRQEYGEHTRGIEGFRQRAVAASGG